MSHFVRCDRCSKEEHVLGTVTLPPGWVKVLNSDLCEPCSAIVRDFIRFKPSDAASLPVEPIPSDAPCQAPPEPSATGEKLFETAPKVETVLERVAEQINAGALDTPTVKCTATVTTVTSATSEASTEERTRTRKASKTRAKLMGQDAILPDPRPAEAPRPKQTDFPHGHNAAGEPPAGAQP